MNEQAINSLRFKRKFRLQTLKEQQLIINAYSKFNSELMDEIWNDERRLIPVGTCTMSGTRCNNSPIDVCVVPESDDAPTICIYCNEISWEEN